MTEKEKQLLLIELCSRLPYRVICHASEINLDGELLFINRVYNIVALHNDNATGKFDTCPIADVRPYLRPMSSMTEEEEDEFEQVFEIQLDYLSSNEDGHTIKSAASSAFEIDFYNRHRFDYRGLIPMGLAIEMPLKIYKELGL